MSRLKVLTIVGTRPELIKLCRVIAELERCFDHVLVHTGQNYDTKLDTLFFEELDVRAPDHHMGVRGTLGEQVGRLAQGL